MEYFNNAHRKKLPISILGNLLVREYEDYYKEKFANPPNQPHTDRLYYIKSIQLIQIIRLLVVQSPGVYII